MALRPQATALRQPTPLRQPMALLEDMPVEPTVALLAKLIALRPMALLPRPMAVISPTPLGRDRRPMTWRGPATETHRTSGTPPPARTDAATCASRIPTRCAVMGTKRRARPPKNERRSPLILSQAPRRGFSLWNQAPRPKLCQCGRPSSAIPSTCLAPLRRGPFFQAGSARQPSGRSISLCRMIHRVVEIDRLCGAQHHHGLSRGDHQVVAFLHDEAVLNAPDRDS